MRQLLAEGCVLAAGGAIFGWAIANVFSRSIVWQLRGQTRRCNSIRRLARELAFTAVVALATCILFDLCLRCDLRARLPAWR